jgi:hypothetical protein
MGKHGMTRETVSRLRTWCFAGVIVCGGLMLGLANAAWADGCGGGDILGVLGTFFSCSTITGAESHVVFGFGDGRAVAGLAATLLALSALALASDRSRRTWMMLATVCGLAATAVAGSALAEYEGRGTVSQSLLILTAASAAATVLGGVFIWLDIMDEQQADEDNEAWA